MASTASVLLPGGMDHIAPRASYTHVQHALSDSFQQAGRPLTRITVLQFPPFAHCDCPRAPVGRRLRLHSSRNSRCEVRPLEDRAGRDIPRESAACSACAQHRVLRTKLRASLLRPQPRPSDARGGICDFGGYAPITASHCVGEMPVDGRKGMRVLSLTTSPA
jgi:hypothetical protein